MTGLIFCPGDVSGLMTALCAGRREIPQMNRHVDWSPETNRRRTHYKALDTPTLAESSISVTSLEDKDQ